MKAPAKSTVFFALRLLGIALIVVFVASIAWVAGYGYFGVKHTPQMLFYQFGHKSDSLRYQVEYQWTPVDSMSNNIIVAVLAGEDGNFYVHNGFSPIDNEDSVTTFIPPKHETITQKTAHAVFLTAGDSWAKNMLEPYFTVLEEYFWGKDRILEIYLNTALVGDGIFGVEAASQIYFSKPASDLTKSEAAYIAALMERSDAVDMTHPDDELSVRQKSILLKMAFMTRIKLGKKAIDESNLPPSKPIYRRNWRG